MDNVLDQVPKAVKAGCGCHACRPITMEDMRMVLCATCGNKRCPKANNHRYACSGSNNLEQPGSAYSDIPYGGVLSDD